MSVHEFASAGNDVCAVCGMLSWSPSAEHEPKIDPDELVTVIYGAGTGNEFAWRLPRFTVWSPPESSAFVDLPDAES